MSEVEALRDEVASLRADLDLERRLRARIPWQVSAAALIIAGLCLPIGHWSAGGDWQTIRVATASLRGGGYGDAVGAFRVGLLVLTLLGLVIASAVLSLPVARQRLPHWLREAACWLALLLALVPLALSGMAQQAGLTGSEWGGVGPLLLVVGLLVAMVLLCRADPVPASATPPAVRTPVLNLGRSVGPVVAHPIPAMLTEAALPDPRLAALSTAPTLSPALATTPEPVMTRAEARALAQARDAPAHARPKRSRSQRQRSTSRASKPRSVGR